MFQKQKNPLWISMGLGQKQAIYSRYRQGQFFFKQPLIPNEYIPTKELPNAREPLIF